MNQRSQPAITRVALVAATTLGVAASLLTVVSPAAGRVPQPSAQVPADVNKGRYALGDSVMLGAKSNLRNRGFRVNAAGSRQVSDGIDVLRSQKRRGKLPKNVVVHLGTNGTFTAGQCGSMHRLVGAKRKLFVVTIKVRRSWSGPNNRVLTRCARKFGNTHLIDWRKFAVNHGWATYADGYHLTSRGAVAYANLIDRNVSR